MNFDGDTLPGWQQRDWRYSRRLAELAQARQREQQQDTALVTAAGVAIGFAVGGFAVALLGAPEIGAAMLAGAAILALGVIGVERWLQ